MSKWRPRPLVAGGVCVVVYVVVAILTIRASDDHVRPLFQGIGPHSPYQWVNPPKAFAAGNVKPHANDAQTGMGPNGNLVAGVGSTDGQIVVNLPEGAIAPHPPDDHVTMRFTPLDGGKLGDTPAGIRFNGNAYRVEASYQPSGAPIAALDAPGNVILTVPEPAQGLLFSPDGRSWQQVETQRVGGPGTVGGPFSQTGYYLATASPFTAPPDDGNGSGSWMGTIVVGALTAALALLLVFGPGIGRRIKRRQQRSEPAAARAAGRQRAKAKRKATGTRSRRSKKR